MNSDPIEKEEFPIQSYTHRQLAEVYRTPVKTFRRWLLRLQPQLGPRIGHFYNPKQVKFIVDQLGRPFVWIGSWWGWKLMLRMVTGGGDPGEDGLNQDGLSDGEPLKPS